MKPLFLIALAFVGPALAQQPSRVGRAAAPKPANEAERRAAGQAILQREVREYGTVDRPTWRRSVDEVVARLRLAAAEPNLELQTTIVRNPSINASAAPGGFIIVNAGLLNWIDSLARAEAPAQEQEQRGQAYLASVLAHELAHITLRHTDRVIEAMKRRMPLTSRNQPVREPALFERELKIRPEALAAFREVRGLELAADSMGALYLLRGGWEIQAMMDLFRRLEATDGPGSALVATYLRSHPRGSTREAVLEGLRARLKLNQGRLDDALALINTNTELGLAIALVDSVLQDFPGLTAGLHARAAAYQRLWLNTASIRALQLRSSLLTYQARLLPAIRGAAIPGDSILYQRARAAYRRILDKEELPGALSNLAVLDGYGGRTADAIRAATRAIELQPDDPRLINNLGVVRFLAGDRPGARDAFRRALARAEPDEDPAMVFNLGKTLAVLGDPAAGPTLEGFLAFGERSAWETEAIALLGRKAGDPKRPEPSSPPPPAVQGLRIGMPRAEVAQLIGPPSERSQVNGGEVLHYARLGLNVGIQTRGSGEPGGGRVRFIALLRPDAGEIDGVRVGTPLQDIRQRWGWPVERAEHFHLFGRGTWLAGVDFGDPRGSALRLYVIEREPE